MFYQKISWKNGDLFRMNLMTLLRPKGDIEYLHKEDTLRQGLERMRIYGYTALPVIDENGCYVGSVNEGDFLWHILRYHKCDLQELEGFRIKEIIRKNWMTPVYVYATIDEMIERAANQNYVPVVDDRNVFIGIITRRDIINAFQKKMEKEDAEERLQHGSVESKNITIEKERLVHLA